MSKTDVAGVSPIAAVRRRPVRGLMVNEGESVSRVWVIVGTGIMVVAALYFLFPVAWLVVASTKSAGDLFSTPGFAFAHFNLWKNVSELSSYDGGIFWRWCLNSVIYSVLGSVVTTFISAMCGYALAVYRFRGRRVLIGAILASMLVPGTVLAQPTYELIIKLGLNNSYAGLILPALVYPFGVLLCYIYAQNSVPLELVEAARLDGAHDLRIFAGMGLRLMSTGLVTVLLFAFLGSWNSYLLPLLVLTDQQLMPVTVGLAQWGAAVIDHPELQILTVVGALVSVVPVIIAFAALQRFWRSGLTAGGLRF